MIYARNCSRYALELRSRGELAHLCRANASFLGFYSPQNSRGIVKRKVIEQLVSGMPVLFSDPCTLERALAFFDYRSCRSAQNNYLIVREKKGARLRVAGANRPTTVVLSRSPHVHFLPRKSRNKSVRCCLSCLLRSRKTRIP